MVACLCLRFEVARRTTIVPLTLRPSSSATCFTDYTLCVLHLVCFMQWPWSWPTWMRNGQPLFAFAPLRQLLLPILPYTWYCVPYANLRNGNIQCRTESNGTGPAVDPACSVCHHHASILSSLLFALSFRFHFFFDSLSSVFYFSISAKNPYHVPTRVDWTCLFVL